jgi:meso-butanediol dehydrogenase/(S,S)-butanediol dehydrogenase/diacetyl reductase
MNKIAVITGANGSIGKTLAERLRKNGIRCICVDKEGKEDNDFFLSDLSEQRQVMNLLDNLVSKFKKIDYLFNVAGIGIYKDIEDLTISEWNDSLMVNLSAPYILSKGLLPLLKKSDDALIVNIGSGMGVKPSAGRIAYCTSKFGLRGMSLSFSKEFGNSNLKVVLLTLGSVMTNFGTGGLEHRKKLAEAGKKYLTSEDVADKIVEIVKSPDKKPEYFMYPQGYILDN